MSGRGPSARGVPWSTRRWLSPPSRINRPKRAEGPSHQGAGFIDVGRTVRLLAAVFDRIAVWYSCATEFGGIVTQASPPAFSHRPRFMWAIATSTLYNIFSIIRGRKDLRETSQQVLTRRRISRAAKVSKREREDTGPDTRVCLPRTSTAPRHSHTLRNPSRSDSSNHQLESTPR